jgi:translation initiation factor 5B
MYVGTKLRRSNSVLDKNGLTNGKIYVLCGNAAQHSEGTFTSGSLAMKWVEIPNGASLTAAQLSAQADISGGFGFIRVEDIEFDPTQPTRSVFLATTGGSGPNKLGRLYELTMNPTNPLANGTLKRGDQIVMCGFSGPVVTRVRELLTPRPLREMRVKTDYLHHESIDGAMGIKICANNLEGVVAGSACLVPYKDVPYDLEVLKEDVMSDLSQLAKDASEVNGGVGVYAIASTLGSLEALLEFLKTSKIPVSAVNIGPIHKKDVMKASIMHQFKSEYATILAFDVNLTKEGADMAKELNVRIFTAEIIYHLFDQFTAYMADVRKAQQAAAALTAVFPCVCQISSPEHVWCRGGGGDPILVGMDVKEGTLRVGTPICVERKGQKDPTTGLQAYLDIGRVIGIEINRKQVNMVKVGQSAAVKIDAVTTVQFGRHFDHTYEMYSHVTRPSIDALKEFFREDLVNEDLQLLVRLKKQFGVL